MYKLEIEKADGTVTFFEMNGTDKLWHDPKDADYTAERLHYRFADTERYARWSVVDAKTGETYSDWEC